jgi:hypothetical protein
MPIKISQCNNLYNFLIFTRDNSCVNVEQQRIFQISPRVSIVRVDVVNDRMPLLIYKLRGRVQTHQSMESKHQFIERLRHR